MSTIDKVIFGDNQFFGINHMSEEKAQELAERFHDLGSIMDVYETALEAGIRAIMLNSNDRAADICEQFRSRRSTLPELHWYPSIPYPHKYANLVNERGMVGTLNNVLFQNGNAISGVGKLVQGSYALVSMDVVKLMKILIDTEMHMFRDLNVRVVFLQNVITDLLLGLNARDLFAEYCEHVRQRYGAMPGLITLNMPLLRRKLLEWKITGVVICSSINKIGFAMSPDQASYENALQGNDSALYPMMAMSTLASGALKASEAYDYINRLNVQSVVFGASSRGHIEETLQQVRLA